MHAAQPSFRRYSSGSNRELLHICHHLSGITLQAVNASRNNKVASHGVSGRVCFDDRGNASWETWRGRRLEHAGLALADQAPSPGAPINVKAAGGHDPYESGVIMKKTEERPRKEDLRALSQWIELQKKLKPQND